MAKKKKNLLTPVGNSKWSWIHKPDAKFANKKTDEVYKISLILDSQDEFVQTLDELVDAAWKVKTKDLKPGQLKKLRKRKPYTEELDEDGNETGMVQINFKTYAWFEDKKTEELTQKQVPVFDAKGRPYDPVPIIGNGSKVQIAFSPNPYIMPATESVGVTLYLNAIQVLKLEKYEKDGGAYGFGKHEMEEEDEEWDDDEDNPFTNDGDQEEDEDGGLPF